MGLGATHGDMSVFSIKRRSCAARFTKKNPTRAPPVKPVLVELPLFYSKTGISASSADRSALAGGLTFLGAANIRSTFRWCHDEPGVEKTAPAAEKIVVTEEDHAECYRQPHRIRACIE
jgi:hypothetical protein